MKKQSKQSGFTFTTNFRQLRVIKRIIERFLLSRWQFVSQFQRTRSVQLKNGCRGFSLVETLVAITVLLIVIIGPMTIITTTSNSASFASDQVIAFFLAQEGVELAQKARDDLVLNRFLDGSDGRFDDTPWDDFSNPSSGQYQQCFEAGVWCGLEIGTDAEGTVQVIDCGASADACDLWFDDSGGNVRSRYTHDDDSGGNLETPYSRTIEFQNINSQEVRVVSTVEWFSGQTRDAQSISVETVLIDVYAQ